MGIFAKDKDYVSITFGEETLKMVYLRMVSSSMEVINVIKRDIRGISEEDLPKTIESALSAFNIKKPIPICVIPSHYVTTKNIEIPSLDPQEIKSIIDLQAGRHTPYSREEIIIDYINIGIYQRNYSKILLAIINRDVVKKQLSALENAGLKVEKVLFAPEGVVRFYSKALNLANEETPVGIIDVGEHFTEFSVEFRGAVIACRSIATGLAHLNTEGKEAFDKLVEELKQSADSYQSEDIERMPENYILTSDDNLIKELQPVLKEVLKTNVKIVPYLDNIKIRPEVRKDSLDSVQDSFLNIVAPIEVLSDLHMDFIPEEIKMQRTIEEQGREVAKSGVFAFIILVIICALFFTKIHFKSEFLKNMKRSYEPKRKEAQRLKTVTSRTRIVKDYFNKRLLALNVLNELFKIIPEEIYLENVSLEEDGKIIIRGISESMSRVFSLVGSLEDSELFKGVKTTSTTAKKQRGKDVAAFEVSFRLEGTQETEEEIAPEEEEKKE